MSGYRAYGKVMEALGHVYNIRRLCYSLRMNLILFKEHEIKVPLQGRDKRALHLLKTLRKKTGDTFEAGVLEIGAGVARIDSVQNDGSVYFSFLQDIKKLCPKARLPIRIGVGFVRPIQIRRILREISSLGVCAIDFFGTDLGEKSYRNTSLFTDGGAEDALIEGAVQSRDTTIPKLNVFKTISEWFTHNSARKNYCVNNSVIHIAMDNVETDSSLFKANFYDGNNAAKVTLAIGPERGWSSRERGLFEENGFKRLSMGNRALRTETACIAAVMLIIEKLQ
jgi:RsmE family RNA methyltransferase